VFTLQRAVCSLSDEQLLQLSASVEHLLTQLPEMTPSTRRTARRRRT
jgi:hypothetical protein